MRIMDMITQDELTVLDILSTSPTTSVGNEQGQQIKIQV